LYLLHLAKRLCQEENPSKVEVIDNNGVLIDIDVQPLTIIATVESKTADLDHFFSQLFEHVGANGKVKKHRVLQFFHHPRTTFTHTQPLPIILS
jgi:hypothetical protein